MRVIASLIVGGIVICLAFLLFPTAGRSQSPLPFDPAPLSVLQQSSKKVFGHYMTQYPISLDNQDPNSDQYVNVFLNPGGLQGKYLAQGGLLRERPIPRAPVSDRDWMLHDLETEVRQAEAVGLDGFTVDVYTTAGVRWQRTLDLLTAANNVDPNFKIIIMPDMASLTGDRADQIPGIVEALAKYPAAMRLPDGRLVISAFKAEAQPPDFWQGVFQQLNSAGIKVAFVPTFLSWKDREPYASLCHGFGMWGSKDATSNAEPSHFTEEAHKDVPIAMMPVGPQDERPKSYGFYEALGSQNYRNCWMNAIKDSPDWVQIVTWNDYGECSEMRPSTSIGYSYYDLTAYYVNWYKTGKQPPITRDVLYYFHRLQPTTAKAAFQDPGERPFDDKGRTPAADQIELLAFLTKPGHIAISIAGQVYGEDAPAGITSFTCPLAPGVPEFSLTRNGQTAISFKSLHPISDTVVHWNMQYAGGSSARQGQ
jgi:hypothetical protein